jgi:hypothetical protein
VADLHLTVDNLKKEHLELKAIEDELQLNVKIMMDFLLWDTLYLLHIDFAHNSFNMFVCANSIVLYKIFYFCFSSSRFLLMTKGGEVIG